MEKKIVRDKIFSKIYSYIENIKFSDLPTNLLPDDIINVHRYESNENGEWMIETELVIERERLESDEEFEFRKIEKKEFEKQKQFVFQKSKKRKLENLL